MQFCDRVQLDSIVYNELADPAELLVVNCAPPFGGAGFRLTSAMQDSAQLAEQFASQKYSIINLRYDLTPVSSVSMIATETGLIPPTSVPVVIRELRYDVRPCRSIGA